MRRLALALVFTAAPVAAQPGEIEYPKGSLGFEAIASQDYARAETQMRSDIMVRKDDPAWLINYGHVLAKTGRLAEAARQFDKARKADDIELILADGQVMSSRSAAERALQSVSVGGPDPSEP